MKTSQLSPPSSSPPSISTSRWIRMSANAVLVPFGGGTNIAGSLEAPRNESRPVIKTAIQQAFVDLGGTLSHRHAVGVEHAPSLSQDISPAGTAMIRTLFSGIPAEISIRARLFKLSPLVGTSQPTVPLSIVLAETIDPLRS